MGLAHLFPTHLLPGHCSNRAVLPDCTLPGPGYHTGNVQPTQIHLQHGHTQTCAGLQRTADNHFLHWNFAHLPRMKRKTVMEQTFDKKLTAGIELTVWKLVSRKIKTTERAIIISPFGILQACILSQTKKNYPFSIWGIHIYLKVFHRYIGSQHRAISNWPLRR